MRNHPTADEVYEKVSETCPNISRGTVYRDLNLLAECGDILRVAVANAPDRYDLTTMRHSHCLCGSCGRVFDYALKTEPELSEDSDGFLATGYELIVRGTCGECRRKENG